MNTGINRVGISGGTFDPIHHGHLIVAEEIRQQYLLDKVLFIPSGTPPHKRGRVVTPAAQRLEMVKMAVRSNPCFEASGIEVEREGYTYTIDTLRQLRANYGDGTKLFFIIGADVVHDLLTWKEYRLVFGMCEFIAVMRPGFDSAEFRQKIEYLKTEFAVSIHPSAAPLVDISSTAIRDMVRKGRSIKYLVPEAVEAYIYDNAIYTGGEED